MARLGISQVPGSDPPQFLVRNRDTEQAAPQAAIPSPYEWPVPDAGDEPLMAQLRWYLETFLSYPFEPYTVRAEQIEAALKRGARRRSRRSLPISTPAPGCRARRMRCST